MLAATAYLRVLPLIHLRSLYKDKDEIEEEIFELAASGSAADELRMEQLNKRQGRLDRHILAIRAASADADQG